jgi:spore coat polysaccharide biosynthesis protein SpsF
MSNVDLWAGTFGDEYSVRCDRDYSPRDKFWGEMIRNTKTRIILEVGCNTGQNLSLIAEYLPHRNNAWGCDVNQRALDICHIRHKEINAVKCSGFALPFKDDYFDMVFTAGVLIHQQPSEVETMMQEIIRVSGRYVLALEYANDTFKEIPYRGQDHTLFKGPYGDIYEKKYGLKLITSGFLTKETAFDDITFWLLCKR